MEPPQLDAAAQAFLSSCNMDPTVGESWNNLAGTYLKAKKKEAAFKAFEEATKILRNHPKVRCHSCAQ